MQNGQTIFNTVCVCVCHVCVGCVSVHACMHIGTVLFGLLFFVIHEKGFVQNEDSFVHLWSLNIVNNILFASFD